MLPVAQLGGPALKFAATMRPDSEYRTGSSPCPPRFRGNALCSNSQAAPEHLVIMRHTSPSGSTALAMARPAYGVMGPLTPIGGGKGPATPIRHPDPAARRQPN